MSCNLKSNENLIKNLEERNTAIINEKQEISKETASKILILEKERDGILELKSKEKMDYDSKILEINNIINDKKKEIASLLDDKYKYFSI